MTSLTATRAAQPPAVSQRTMPVDGAWVEAADGRWLDVENPARQSGMGREFSLEGMLDSFTQRKSVTINLQF